jgi:NAD(P)-dependent dehydrogenase (short-subunit alcohol dehydrogenase family)
VRNCMDEDKATSISSNMDRILIIGASGGIGTALAAQAQARGAQVVRLSRSADGIDVTDDVSVASVMGRLEGAFDAILVATGALEIAGAAPEKTIKSLDPTAFMAQMATNALGPALVLKHGLRLLSKERRAVFVALSARVGSIGDNRLGGWYSYRASKAALNQLIRTASIEVARSHPKAVLAALHPGTVQTQFTEKYLGRHPAVPPEEAATHIWRVIDGLEPSQTGCFRDWRGETVAW